MGNPRGGTELQKEWLLSCLPKEILNRVQIICRPEQLEEDKIKVLWVQDMPRDLPFLLDENNRKLFAKIVFVSSWQQTIFNLNASIPFSDSVVIKNAVMPIQQQGKDKDTIRLIYHPTPHRGLQILVPVFERLCEKYDNLHLDVFSSFKLYDREQLDIEYEYLYDKCRKHSNITYHGSQSNDTVRNYLAKSHIFAYPCIWRETSCMSAMEAMTARCLVVAPNYGALPETLANYNISYDWTEDISEHEKIFEKKLSEAIESIGSQETEKLLDSQKDYADTFYNKNTRINQWTEFLSTVDYPQKKEVTLTWI